MKENINNLTAALIIICITVLSYNYINTEKKEINEDKDTTHLLRFTPQNGDRYDFDFSVSMTDPVSVDMGMELTYYVLSIDNNEIDMAIEYTNMSMDMSMGVESFSYDSRNPGGSEFSDFMHEQLRTMFSSQIECTVSDRGKTIKAPDFASLFDVNPDMQKQMEDMNYQMESMFVEYPEKALKIGDSFDIQLDKKDMDMDAVYTLMDVTETEYILSFNADLSGLSEERPITGTMKGTLHVLRECGMTMSGDIIMDMETEGMNMTLKLLMEAKKS